MNSNKFLIIICCFLALTVFSGCQKDTEEVPVTQTVDSQNAVTPAETQEYGEITDPVELEALWQEYFYDAIHSVMGNAGFTSTQEIAPVSIADFCFAKYADENGTDRLQHDEEGSRTVLFPMDAALEYAKRYFDLTSIDISGLDPSYYSEEKNAFIFMPHDKPKPKFEEGNPWGEGLDTVTRNRDGSLTAVFTSKTSGGLIETVKTLTLNPREDGGYYFASYIIEYINNHLVKISGDYQCFDKITGLDKNIDPENLTMLGEIEGQIILAYLPCSNNESIILMLVDPNVMTVTKKLETDYICEITDISAIGEKIIIRLNDKYISLDKNLENLIETKLPDVIPQLINREEKVDDNGLALTWFGGYDISPDCNEYAYADETGLWLLDTTDYSKKLISNTVEYPNSDLLKFSYHINPRFVDSGNKIITIMSGYEGSNGYTLCDLISGQTRELDISAECSNTGLIRYDNGILEVNTFTDFYGDSDCLTLYLDFSSENTQQITLEDTGYTDAIRFPEWCYVGERHAAFITFEPDRDDCYLNRLDLATLTVEPKIVTVTAAQCYILGVLSDGRVIFGYNLNPSECGICVTD